jgi:hypothetical protein
MVFIYVYYGLFACRNLVDVMWLFFMVFSFHLPIFDKNLPVFGKNCPKVATLVSEKPADLSAKPANLSVFLVFTIPPSSPVRFGRIFLIFTDFYQFFQKPTGSVMSGFRSSTEFLNTSPSSACCGSSFVDVPSPVVCALIFPEASPPLKATVLDFSVQSPTQPVLVIWILPLSISSVPALAHSPEPGSPFCWVVLDRVARRRPGQILMSPGVGS